MTTMPEPRAADNIPLIHDTYRRAPGALAPLLDLRFTRFIAVRIVQALYVIGAALIALATLIGVVALFRVGFAVGLTALVFLPPLAFVALLGLRAALEMVVALFRIAENTSRMVELAERRA